MTVSKNSILFIFQNNSEKQEPRNKKAGRRTELV